MHPWPTITFRKRQYVHLFRGFSGFGLISYVANHELPPPPKRLCCEQCHPSGGSDQRPRKLTMKFDRPVATRITTYPVTRWNAPENRCLSLECTIVREILQSIGLDLGEQVWGRRVSTLISALARGSVNGTVFKRKIAELSRLAL